MDLISGLRYKAANEAAGPAPASDALGQAFSLTGRTAVVTGAGSGIGAATAAALAAAGARVVLADRSPTGLDETAAAVEGSLAVPTDVCDKTAVEDLARAALRATGRIDVWANVAGIIRTAPIVDTTEADLDEVLAANLKGVFWGVATAGRVMSAARQGSIVNVASCGGEVPAPERSVYGMSKAAVIHLTKTAAAELGPAGIRVNAVAPGFIETAMTRRLWLNGDGLPDEAKRAQVLDALSAQSPLRTVGLPDDIAWAIVYLATDASRFMTGEVLRPNGGVFMA